MIGGMLSQNILNLVDTLMIGQLGHSRWREVALVPSFITSYSLDSLAYRQGYKPWLHDSKEQIRQRSFLFH